MLLCEFASKNRCSVSSFSVLVNLLESLRTWILYRTPLAPTMAGRLGKGRPGQLVVDTSTGISHGGIRKTPKSSTPKTPASRLAAGYRKQKLTTARHPRIHIRTRAPTHTHTHTHTCSMDACRIDSPSSRTRSKGPLLSIVELSCFRVLGFIGTLGLTFQ